MMTRALLALALLATAGTASSQPRESEASLQSLRGFGIGSQCLNLHETYEGLRAEGFKVAPASRSCVLTPGEYRIDRMLKSEDGREELIEVYFAPDSTVWRVKVSLIWEGLYKLSPKPTPEQVMASLTSRFGAPYLQTNDGALLSFSRNDAHAVAFAWAPKRPKEGPGTATVDGFGWTYWSTPLKGTVTMANLRWFDDTSRQTLTVETTNRWMLPYAAEARLADERREAERRAQDDAKALGKL